MPTLAHDLNRQILILAVAQLTEPSVSSSVRTEDLRTRVNELGGDEEFITQDELNYLVSLGWMSTKYITYDDRGVGRITPLGVSTAQDFEQKRNDAQARRVKLRDLFLRWLYTETQINDAHMPSVDNFLSTDAHYLGTPFTQDDLNKALEWLKDNEFISGIGSWGRAILRGTITTKGISVVERNRSVMDSETTSIVNNTTVHGPANIANQSPGTHQTIVQDSAWASQLLTHLEAVHQALPTLPDEVRADITEAVSGAIEAARAEDASRARSATQRIQELLSATAAGALGNLLSSGLTASLPLIPIS